MSSYVSISFILGIYSLPWPSLHFFLMPENEENTWKRMSQLGTNSPGQMREAVDSRSSRLLPAIFGFFGRWCGWGWEIGPSPRCHPWICSKGFLGGGNSNIFGIFTPTYLGKMNIPILTVAYIFQVGLVQPPTRFPWCSWGFPKMGLLDLPFFMGVIPIGMVGSDGIHALG